jgi:hypothetical protein
MDDEPVDPIPFVDLTESEWEGAEI